MRKSFKYRIYLTKGQHRILEQQLEECRWVSNETLAERKRADEERGESLHVYDTQALLPVWKVTRPALNLERIANRRADFAHQESRTLVDGYQVIVFEDLAPMEMGKSRGMRKSILDVAWTQFISMTVAKAEEAGRRVILVNPRNTTKLCSTCGEIVPKALSVRVHTCPHCGLVMDRDENAALNILQRGLLSLRQ